MVRVPFVISTCCNILSDLHRSISQVNPGQAGRRKFPIMVFEGASSLLSILSQKRCLEEVALSLLYPFYIFYEKKSSFEEPPSLALKYIELR